MEDQSMEGNFEINREEGFILVSINPKIYPLDVVLSAAYVLIDEYYVLVDGDPKEEIMVEIRSKNKKKDLEEVGRRFNNLLIEYANYAVQSLKNEKLREMILQRVLQTNNSSFNNTEKCSCEETKSDEFDDPDKIAIPWVEKYGKDKDQ